MTSLRLLLLGSLIGGIAVTGGCITGSSLPAPVKVAARTDAQYVAAGISRPSAIVAAADGRVFFTEKDTGRIRVISAGELLETPFAEVPVNAAGDRGLLGIALHPNFERNGRVYVFYTRSDTGETTSDPQAVIDNRVVYFVALGDTADGGEVFVASLPAGGTTNRISGRLAFDKDAKLFVALGDLGEEAAPQADDALGGKVLRYNDDGSIPSDNPIAGSPIFARGVRNVSGLGIDAQSNVIFAADDNDSGDDEMNRILSGKNYGWPVVIGDANTAAEREFVDNTPAYVAPLLTQKSNTNMTGLAFNPGAKYGAGNQGELFYGEAAHGLIRRATLSGDRISAEKQTVFAEHFPSTIRDIAFTPNGTLYVACDKAIFRCVTYP